MKNIAIIINKLNNGGAERVSSNLSIELSKDYNVIFIVMDGSNQTYPYEGKFYNLNMKHESFLKRLLRIRTAIRELKEIKRKENVDCTISLLTEPNILNVLSRVNDKIIVSVRNKMTKSSPKWLYDFVIPFTSKRADMTVALSKMVEKELLDYYQIPQEKVMTIYNHCDSKLLKELSQDSVNYQFNEDTLYIVNMGRLVFAKGQWHLIRAFSLVHRRIPQAKLLILGEGDYREKLEKLISMMNLNDNVELLGYRKNPHNIIRNCDLFVFSSMFEGLGNALLEGISCGLPVISCDCPSGPREIIAPDSDLNSSATTIEYEKYGILVPVCDDMEDDWYMSELSSNEVMLAESICEMLVNEEKREYYRKMSRERIKDFDSTLIMNQWKTLIDKIE